MKKRKRSAHLDIKIAKRTRRFIRWHKKQPNYAVNAKYQREIFAPRPKQKRRMYLWLERKDNQLCKS